MHCTNCGTLLTASSTFCFDCGRPVAQPVPNPALPPRSTFTPGGPSMDYKPVGFFSALFDFSFKRKATEHIVKVLFVLAVVAYGFWAVLILVTSLAAASQRPVLLLVGLIGAPLIFILPVAAVRVFLELVVSVTQIEQHTRSLDITGRGAGAGGSELR